MSGEEVQHSKPKSTLFADINVGLKSCMEIVSKMQLNDNRKFMKDGISLLDLKNQMMLLYEMNLVALLQCKVTGKSLQKEGKEIVRRLARLRPVLERIRALEHRLQYRIDKLLKAASQTDAEAEGGDPLSFRPRPDGMVGGDENDDNSEPESIEGSVDERTAAGQSGKYVPPKLRAMYYNDDKQVEKTEVVKRSKLRASVVAELQQEFSQAPDEERDVDGSYRFKRQLEKASEQREYEESNFVRLQTPKRSLRNTTQGRLQDLLDFGQDDRQPGGIKRPRASDKNKSKKKKMKMRRKRPGKKF